MAILRSKGLEAFYTKGQKPQPFLEKAFDDSREQINKIFEDALIKEVKEK
jgi:hypothetical protein